MANPISSIEKTDPERMIKKSDAERDAAQKARDEQDRNQKSSVHNNDSDVAPEKDKNDVMRRHE